MADTIAPGKKEADQLKFAGFSDDEINQWRADTTSQLQSGGFTPQEIKDYFGDTPPDTTAMKDYVTSNFQKENEPTPDGKPKEAKNFMDAFVGGLQISTTGLAVRGEMPSMIMPEQSTRAMNIANMVGTMVGDIPAMIAGGFMGSVVGAPVGGAAGSVVPVVGTLGGVAAGAAVGMGAGSFALPTALRKIMMDHYEKGDIKSSADFWDRLSATTYETMKSAVIGGATFGVGKAVGAGTKALGAGTRVQNFSQVSSEIATMTTMGAALEGQLPEPEEFITNGLLIGGIHGFTHGAGKLRQIYANRGTKPAEVMEMSKTDPVLRQEMTTDFKPEILGEKLAVEVKVEGNPVLDGVKINEKLQFQPEKVKTEKIGEEVKLFNKDIPRTEAEMKILSQVGEQVTPKEKVDLVKMYKDFTNDLHPVNTFVKELSEGKKLAGEIDPRVLSQTYRGWHGLVDRVVNYGTVKFGDLKTQTGEGLIQILKDVPGQDKDGLTAYGMAKRALEKSKQGVETGLDLTAAQEVVKNGAKFEPVFKRLVDFNNRIMDYATDSGLLSKESAQMMKEMNKDYFPFHRVMEVDPFDPKGGSRGLFKTMTGSQKKIVDPISTSYKNMIAIVRASERNRVFKSIVDLAKESPKGEEFLKEVKKDIKAIKVTEKEVAKMLDDLGAGPDVTAEPFTIFRAKDHILKDNEFTYFENGKARTFKVKPEMAEALNALDLDPGPMNLFMKISKGFASTLRLGVTATPDFQFRNFFRDQFTASVQSKYGQIPFVDVLQSVKSIWKKDTVWQEFLATGGSSGAFGEVVKTLEADVWKLNKQTGFLNNTWNVMKSPLQALGAASTLIENIPRVTEFRRAGGGKAGAQAAREVTVDFAKGSARSRAINAVVPFFNVGVVSLGKTLESFNKENISKTMTRGTAMITVPSVMLWWANKDDSRYKDAPNWQKNLFWIIPTDKWENAANIDDAMARPEDLRRQLPDGTWQVNNGTVWRMPKPFLHGLVFGTMVERSLDKFFGENPDAFKDFDETMMQAMSVSLVPTIALPVAEQRFNESFFTAQPIVPGHLEDVSPEYQYTNYTSETAKQLGKLIGYVPYIRNIGPKDAKLSSPMVIDNYIRSWGGTLGQYAIDIADGALTATGIAETKSEAPADTLADIPFIKAFVMRHPSMQIQHIKSFYENYDESERLRNSVKKLVAEGKVSEAMELTNNNLDGMIDLDGIRKTLYNHNILIQKINESAGYSRDEKRQLIDGLYYRMSEIAKSGNKTIKQLKEEK